METTIKRKLSIATIEALFFGSDINIRYYNCLDPEQIDEEDLTKKLPYEIKIRHDEDTTAEKEYTSAINKYKRKIASGLPDHETECKRLYNEKNAAYAYQYAVKNKIPISYCPRCEADTPTLENKCVFCETPVIE